ncbi:class C sortase [Ruminococcus flavefaciens]|uniref:class C sortase n=1 Tax=Ruminococcus flavefaciens TaxID=1265 RepID=UPI001563473D|nr:class C sortase [Ruminococcus flavefaciens]
MKNLLLNICIILLFFGGIAVISYPAVSNFINEKHSSTLIAGYEKSISDFSDKDKERILAEAHEYNRALPSVLSEYDAQALENREEYLSALDISGNGIMGVLDIPEIDVHLPIYHGTSEEILRVAAGHLPSTSLPVGGDSTHAVISAHTGLPSSKLFTELDELEIGDMFTVSVLDEVLVYKVDKISVVKPEDVEDLQMIEGEDHVTLLTCTPYGINSHRLLVRGTRAPYDEAERNGLFIGTDAEFLDKTLLIPFGAVPASVICIIVIAVRSGRKRKNAKAE